MLLDNFKMAIRLKRKRQSKAAKINAQLGQVDNVTKNGDPDTSRKNMLGSGEISNPFPQGDADSFVNKSDDVPTPQKKEATGIRKKRKNKGSKRFELNDKGQGPNNQEVAEALQGGGDDFFIGDQEQLY